jgi:hypothetical protein
VGTQVYACTDDGHVISWDANAIRQKAEEDYRMTHKSSFSKSLLTAANSRAVSREGSATPTRVGSAANSRAHSPANTQPNSQSTSRRESFGMLAEEVEEMMLASAKHADWFFEEPLVPPDPGTGGNRRRGVLDPSLYRSPAVTVEPNRCWKGHSDHVTDLMELGEHGCVMTLSMDGLHRYCVRHCLPHCLPHCLRRCVIVYECVCLCDCACAYV